MKAWFVWADDDWGDYVHGETASKAKSMFWSTWNGETEWIHLRPFRVPELDNKLFTPESVGIPDDNELWYSICDCEICEPSA